MSTSHGRVWKQLPFARLAESDESVDEAVGQVLVDWNVSSQLPARRVVALVDGAGVVSALSRSRDQGVLLRANFEPFERRLSAVAVSDPDQLTETDSIHVVTVGLDHSDTLMKIWQVDADSTVRQRLHLKLSGPSTGTPSPAVTPTKTVRSRVSVVALSPSRTAVVAGFSDGSLSLSWSGDDGHPALADTQPHQVRQLRIPIAPGEPSTPISHLSFLPSGRSMFVVTERRVCVVRFPVSDDMMFASCSVDTMRAGATREMLGLTGVSSRFLTATIPESLPVPPGIVVALREGLYFYHEDGNGACIPSNTVPESRIAFQGSFLLMATTNEVIAFDITNKLLVLRHAISAEQNLRAFLFSGAGKGGDTYGLALAANSHLYCVSLRNLKQRVHLLLQHNMYSLAEKLAEEDGPSTMNWVIREHARYELQSGSMEKAGELFASLIGPGFDSSSVIRAIIDAGQNRSGAGSKDVLWSDSETLHSSSRAALEKFLEALHFTGMANEHHTRLLISCYSADTERQWSSEDINDQTLRRFILSVSNSSAQEVDQTIACCREAKLYDSARALAENRERHVILASILIFDTGNATDTIGLVDNLITELKVDDKSLTVEKEILDILDMVGRRLAAVDPQALVDVMMKFLENGGPERAQYIAQFSDCFVDCPHWLHQFLSRALDWISRSDPQMVSDVSENLHTVWMRYFEVLIQLDLLGVNPTHHLEHSGNIACDGNYCPRAYFKDPTISVDIPSIQGKKAIGFVKSSRVQVDGGQALQVSVSSGGNLECDAHLLESTRQYTRLGVVLAGQDDADKLLRACRRYGSREPMLWVDALTMFVRRLESCRTGIAPASMYGAALKGLREIIVAVDRANALTPIELVDVLSDGGLGGGAPLEGFREYFNKIVGVRRIEAMKDEREVSRLRGERSKLEASVNRLRNEAIIVRQRRCGICEDSLELPVVHFLCEHSFHVECLTVGGAMGFVDGRPLSSGMGSSNRLSTGSASTRSPQSRSPRGIEAEAEWQCPICTPSYESATSVRAAMEGRNLRHEEFFKELRSGGGFDTVLERLSQQGLARVAR